MTHDIEVEPRDLLEPLVALGLDDRVRELFGPMAGDGFLLGRVARVDRGGAVVLVPAPLRAEPAWHLAKAAESGSLPAVGDWVAVNADPELDVALIEVVLPRSSAFSRRDPGREAAIQVLAANVDVLLVVESLSDEPNLGRIEREFALAWDSGAQPAIVLTKADLCSDADRSRKLVQDVALEAPVHVTSAIDGTGLEELRRYASDGRTVAFIGPSGAGKSTLVNALLREERQETREVRVTDNKGRHTTIARELLQTPEGGVVIDTPGMRALGLWDGEAGVELAFSDIADLAERCRFRNCAHDAEPGCAVRGAIESGDLAERRLDSYNKLRGELARVAEQRETQARAARGQRPKPTAKATRTRRPGAE